MKGSGLWTLARLAVPLVLAVALSGCTAYNPRGPLVTDYFPLQAGSLWNYQVGSGDNAVEVQVTARPGAKYQGNQTTALYYQVGGLTTQVEYYTGDWNRIEQVRMDKVQGTVTGSGQAASFSELEENPPLLVMDVNALVPPYQWEVDQTLVTKGDGTLTSKTMFTSLGFESVTVPAGTFPRALHIHFIRTVTAADGSSVSVSGDRWFAAGTGLVKAIDQMGSTVVEMQLKDSNIR